MENNLEIVRQACIKANPSIMELSFGCEIKSESGNEIFVKDIGDGSYVLIDENEGDVYTWHGKIIYSRILGRPIRLADVLLAINSCPSWAEIWLVSSAGHIFKSEWIGQGDWGLKNREEMGNPFWDMSKDNLNDQSEETISFLAGLLK